MADELAELTRRVESLELSVAGLLQALPGDGDDVPEAEAAENRRALFELLTEALEMMPATIGDLPAALAVVVDRLDKAGVRVLRARSRRGPGTVREP